MMPKPKKESRISTTSTIQCCHHCVPPKRHTACWDHCPEYAKEKAEYEERKAAYFGNTEINSGLTAQRTNAVKRAMRGRKNFYRNAGKGRATS